MFARALRPPHDDTKVQYVPYGRQVEFAERLGVGAIQGATKSFEGMTVEEIKRLDERLTENWFAIVSVFSRRVLFGVTKRLQNKGARLLLLFGD